MTTPPVPPPHPPLPSPIASTLQLEAAPIDGAVPLHAATDQDSADEQSREGPGSPSPEFLSLIPHTHARRHLVLSAGRSGEQEHLLIAPQTRPLSIFNIGVRLGRSTSTTTIEAETIAAAIDRAYTDHAASQQGSAPLAHDRDDVVVVEGAANVEEELAAALRMNDGDLLATGGKAPVVRLVDLILFDALLAGASDVHIQPLRDRTLVRYRLDGALHTSRELKGGAFGTGGGGNSIASAVVARIKVMGRLDVAERRAPQDGRATVTIGGSAQGHGSMAHNGRRVDLRISILPSSYGERVVIRILDPWRSPHTQSFAALGMPPEIERAYLAQAGKASGIVLSTGPTGSGKTTTLYATLWWISAANAASARGTQGHLRDTGCELNIMTIEDPIEYDLCGSTARSSGPGAATRLSVSQTQVDTKKNMTFAAGLRHILRQDPDVIMVGEIRDQETARIAVQASLTGHLVLSTLHTFDASSAVARLIDLGVEPFLVSSSLSAVLAQRLVRKVHAECGGRGCVGDKGCMNSGFKGRTGVFELLVLTPALRGLIDRRASAVELKEAARRGGMTTLGEAGSALVRHGITTAAELARVIEATEEAL